MKQLPTSPPEHTPPSTQPGSLSARVLSQITTEAISPTPRWRWLVGDYALWLVWAATVFMGAIALSVTAYALLSAPYALYEATHHNLLTFMVELLPSLWLLFLLFMSTLTLLEVRYTRRGYRHRLITILVSSIGLSGLLAIILHCVGFGFWFDQTLGKQMPMYVSFEKQERAMWHAPNKGRYVGALAEKTSLFGPLITPTLIHSEIFIDMDGLSWQLLTDTLTTAEVSLLLRGFPVRIVATSTEPALLYVCAVLPHLFDRPMDKEQVMADKSAYLKRAQTAVHRAEAEAKETTEHTVLNLGDKPEAKLSSLDPCASVSLYYRE